MLQEHKWQVKYTNVDGNLVEVFYVPALQDAQRYARLTGYFNAGALTLAARGIEFLVRNKGVMRLVVGCTLDQPEIEAIHKGEDFRKQVENHLIEHPLEPFDATSKDALELLAWMVQHEFLDVRVAVPCAKDQRPVSFDGIFHEKSGIIEDLAGDRIAWTGSLNETSAGWNRNWETINVSCSWKGTDLERVEAEEDNFNQIWQDNAKHLFVVDVPDAVRQDLLSFAPKTGTPKRLQNEDGVLGPLPTHPKPKLKLGANLSEEMRRNVWAFITEAPTWPDGGKHVGEATCPVDPWPHQIKALERLYRHWPPRLLIADEVGLGKTIQAGLLLRRAWLARRAKRILILAPKSVLKQWQVELREKFNLNWPTYDGKKLVWEASPVKRGQNERNVEPHAWHHEPVVIVSSQLMRRTERAAELLDQAAPWDLVILDEAHHARRRGAGSETDSRPNHLLKLMQKLKTKTEGLVLLTATPMQVDPVEVWDLLNLLGLPPEWNMDAFLKFFEDAALSCSSQDAFEQMARLFRAVENTYGETSVEIAQTVTGLSRMTAKNLLAALRDDSTIPRRRLAESQRSAAVRIMQANTPMRWLVSRHTRALLRKYYADGMLTTRIAERQVEDRFPTLSEKEGELYNEVENYIAETYNRAKTEEKTAVGFVMTIYRRRLASSFFALRKTLEKRRIAFSSGQYHHESIWQDDMMDDELDGGVIDPDDDDNRVSIALAREEQIEIDNLLSRIKQLPPDTKLIVLEEVLHLLFREGYQQVMVFTQYTDTMDFLREELGKTGQWRLMCFSGRGGEVAGEDGAWKGIGRDEAKQRFQKAEAEILLCTDAAAEGLNFQFCGALINYDMPWNPMRVEQRIGRIDRLGQEYETIRIFNLHYEGTVETDVYQALEKRIGLFQTVVGRLQPILAQLPQKISQSVLSGGSLKPSEREKMVQELESEVLKYESRGFDFDDVTETDIQQPDKQESPITMDDLDRVIQNKDLMPPDVRIEPLGNRQYTFWMPGMAQPVRVTTGPSFYEKHAENVELWSPGNPLFRAPKLDDIHAQSLNVSTLKEILDGK